MSILDKLARDLWHSDPEQSSWEDNTVYWNEFAANVSAWGYRRHYVILDHSELAKLPHGSLFLDVRGRVWRAFADGDHDCLEVVGVPSTVPLPATVIYVPEES